MTWTSASSTPGCLLTTALPGAVPDAESRTATGCLRYNDTFVKTDGVWLFSERLLYVDWMDERALA
jgi:hypothetical protein